MGQFCCLFKVEAWVIFWSNFKAGKFISTLSHDYSLNKDCHLLFYLNVNTTKQTTEKQGEKTCFWSEIVFETQLKAWNKQSVVLNKL